MDPRVAACSRMPHLCMGHAAGGVARTSAGLLLSRLRERGLGGEGRLSFTTLAQVVQRRGQVLTATQEDGRVGCRVAAHLGRAQVFDHARDGGRIV